MAKARVTSVGLQFDHAYTADRTLLRVTSVGLQVEIGEWYSLHPLRTRPRIPASRALPLSPASRTGTEAGVPFAQVYEWYWELGISVPTDETFALDETFSLSSSADDFYLSDLLGPGRIKKA